MCLIKRGVNGEASASSRRPCTTATPALDHLKALLGGIPQRKLGLRKKNAIAFSLPANTMNTVDPRAAHSQVCRDAGPRSPTGNVVGSKWVTTVRAPGL